MGRVTWGMGTAKPRSWMVWARKPAYLNHPSSPSPTTEAKITPNRASRRSAWPASRPPRRVMRFTIEQLLLVRREGNEKRLPHRSTRGDESRFHSLLSLKEAIDAGQTGGFHIPRAPGRTFTASAAGALAAGDARSLLQELRKRSFLFTAFLLYCFLSSMVSRFPPVVKAFFRHRGALAS